MDSRSKSCSARIPLGKGSPPNEQTVTLTSAATDWDDQEHSGLRRARCSLSPAKGSRVARPAAPLTTAPSALTTVRRGKEPRDDRHAAWRFRVSTPRLLVRDHAPAAPERDGNDVVGLKHRATLPLVARRPRQGPSLGRGLSVRESSCGRAALKTVHDDVRAIDPRRPRR
jgi:hypothetical protein